MQNRPSEKDIEVLFHSHCPDEQHIDPAAFTYSKRSYFSFFPRKTSSLSFQALQSFIFHRLYKSGKPQFLDIYTQILKEVFLLIGRFPTACFSQIKKTRRNWSIIWSWRLRKLEFMYFYVDEQCFGVLFVEFIWGKKGEDSDHFRWCEFGTYGLRSGDFSFEDPGEKDHELFAHMHNKYVVIDQKGYLSRVSFNWRVRQCQETMRMWWFWKMRSYVDIQRKIRTINGRNSKAMWSLVRRSWEITSTGTTKEKR